MSSEGEIFLGVMKLSAKCGLLKSSKFRNYCVKDIVLEVDMETMKLRAHIGADGILQILTPTDFKDTNVEVVVVVQPLPNAEVTASKEPQAQYNAWGKPTTTKSISNAIALMRQLQREVALDKTSVRSMIEEGRRF